MKEIIENKIEKEIRSTATVKVLDENPDFISIINDYIKKNNNTYYMIIYKVNEVLLKKYLPENNDELRNELEPKFLKEFRIFSKNSELYVWKKGNRFALRFREDGKGDELFDVYIANHIIWGTKINNDNILSEEFRGIQIKLPFTKRIITQGDLPLKYVVNNYIKADKTGLINFIDSRLVEFINDKGEVING